VLSWIQTLSAPLDLEAVAPDPKDLALQFLVANCPRRVGAIA
jgi:hypothetical protein